MISNGFKLVTSCHVYEVSKITEAMLRPGDISTQHYIHKGKSSSHACMWTGKDWRSDNVQRKGGDRGTGMLPGATGDFRDRDGGDGSHSVCIWRNTEVFK